MTGIARATKPQAAPAVQVFQARCQARASIVRAGDLDLIEAVDGLQAAAMAFGLVAEIGQDAVQAIMAAAFADVPRPGDHEAAFAELVDRVENIAADLRMRRRSGAPRVTVEALLYSLRERGEGALVEDACLDRLSKLSTAQLRTLLARLTRLQPKYSTAITADLLALIEEQLA